MATSPSHATRATAQKTKVMAVLLVIGCLMAFQYQFADHRMNMERLTQERETLHAKLHQVTSQMTAKDAELVQLVQEHKKMVDDKLQSLEQTTPTTEETNKEDWREQVANLQSALKAVQEEQAKQKQHEVSQPHPSFPETKYTPHVNDLLQVIDETTLHLDADATNPWQYDPHKFCALGYHMFVDQPYTPPTVIECNPNDVWCGYFLRLFADGKRVLPYNVSLGESRADMIKPTDMAWGQCFGSSGPGGSFSMNNFQEAKAQMENHDWNATGHVHHHTKPWDQRHKIPVFRGHPRMRDRGGWQRNPGTCPKRYRVEKGDFGHRSKAVLFSLDHPDLLDARVSQAWHSCQVHNATNGMDRVFGWGQYKRTDETTKIPSASYNTDYQVAVVLGGIGAAFRTPTHMSAGQAVVLQRFTYEEWYVPYMTPWEHYIPLKNDLSDLKEIMEWVRDNPDKLEQIGQNGKKFYQEWLSFPQTNEHWHELLWRLSELIYHKGPERLKTGTHRTIWPGPIVPQRFIRDPTTGEFVPEERSKTRQPYLDIDGPLGESTQK